MTFKEALTKTGLTEETVSHAIKVKIKRYNNLEAAVAEAKTQLPLAKSARTRVQLERDITKGEENLSGMNEEIVASINKFKENEEVNKKRADNLAKARANKGTKTSDNVNATGDDKGAAPAGTTPAATTPATTTPEPEKKGGGIGAMAIVGGLIVAGVLGYFGWKAFNRE